MMIRKNVVAGLGVAAAGFAPVLAFAEATAPDVSDVVAQIAATSAPITAIGGSILLVIVGIKVFKWVQRVM